MGKPTLSSPPQSESVSQFLRSVEKIQLAQQSRQDPAPYIANARQWLAIVKLANPHEAETLERELKRVVGHTPAEATDKPSSPDRDFLLLRLAWLAVPFALLFTIAGPDVGVKAIAGICLVGLLAFIFLK
jgi:hypothetical protein